MRAHLHGCFYLKVKNLQIFLVCKANIVKACTPPRAFWLLCGHCMLRKNMKAGRPIGNKTAAQIEALCKRPAGWLDLQHPDQKPSPAEDAFIELARKVWRAQNAKDKRTLQQLVRDFGST
jgi:hypothetical protein